MEAEVRRVARTIEPQAVVEGAGVRLIRSIGGLSLDYLDPFLLLDHFESDDPDDYLAGFPLHPHRGIVDFKTCDDLTWFEADARRYGYAHQLAFYRAVLAQVIGIVMPAYIIAVEKKEPFRAGVWRISEDTLAQAQKENEAAIERMKRCIATDTWPTGYEECRVFDAI